MLSNLPIGAENDPRAPWNQTEIVFYCTCCDEEIDYDGESGDVIECPLCGDECEVETNLDRQERVREAYYDDIVEERKLEGRI